MILMNVLEVLILGAFILVLAASLIVYLIKSWNIDRDTERVINKIRRKNSKAEWDKKYRYYDRDY